MLVGRLSTVALMIAACAVSLLLSNALQAFQILLQIGAGTGLLFILRWFWWRISAASEIAAMTISFAVAGWFQFAHASVFGATPDPHQQLLAGVSITTVGWLLVTFLTPATDQATLRAFYRQIRPGGRGWATVVERAAADSEPLETADTAASSFPTALSCMLLGSAAVYMTLFSIGHLLYGRTGNALVLALLALGATVTITRFWRRL